MDIQTLFSRIDELLPEYTEFLADICRLESPTEFKEGVDAVGRYIADKARAFGWKIDIQKQPISGDCICITMNPDAAGRPVCFSGHMDTVHAVGFFGEEPVRIDGDKMYAPGVDDCKGGIAAAFFAMAALHEGGYTARPVKLILQSDEENSSRFSNKTTVEFMCEQAKDAVAMFNMEPADRFSAVTSRKGICRYRLTVHGKAAHSSICYDGKSAICEAAYKIIELEKCKAEHGTTINCGLISGGTAENTVPDSCTFTADVRFADMQGMQDADRLIRETAEKSCLGGTTCEVEVVSSRVPMELTERNLQLLERVNAVYEKHGFTLLKSRRANGGSDAADFTAHGIPCLDSVGIWGGSLHQRGEWASISSLAQVAKRCAALVVELSAE